MQLREAQHQVDEWIGQFKEGYWEPAVQLARLSEELGELSREVLHSHGPKRKKPTEAPGSVAAELGDVLFVLISMANSLHIDLEQAFGETMAKLRARDQDRFERKRPQVNPS